MAEELLGHLLLEWMFIEPVTAIERDAFPVQITHLIRRHPKRQVGNLFRCAEAAERDVPSDAFYFLYVDREFIGAARPFNRSRANRVNARAELIAPFHRERPRQIEDTGFRGGARCDTGPGLPGVGGDHVDD